MSSKRSLSLLLLRICFVGRPGGNSIGLSYIADNILNSYKHFGKHVTLFINIFLDKNKILANSPKMLIVALLIMTNTGTDQNAQVQVSTFWNIYKMYYYMTVKMIMIKLINT